MSRYTVFPLSYIICFFNLLPFADHALLANFAPDDHTEIDQCGDIYVVGDGCASHCLQLDVVAI